MEDQLMSRATTSPEMRAISRNERGDVSMGLNYDPCALESVNKCLPNAE